MKTSKNHFNYMVLLSATAIMSLFVVFMQFTISQKTITTTKAGSNAVLGKYSTGSCSSDSDCNIAGCSNHFCSSDRNLITTCEYKSDFPNPNEYKCGCSEKLCAWIKK